MYSRYSNHVRLAGHRTENAVAGWQRSHSNGQRSRLEEVQSTHIAMLYLCGKYILRMLSDVSMVMTFVFSHGEYGGRSISRSQCCRQFSKPASL